MAIDSELYTSAIRSVLGNVEFRVGFGDYVNVTESGILEQVFDDNSLPLEPQKVTAVKTAFVSALKHHIRRKGPFSEIHGASRIIGRLLNSEDHVVAIATGAWRESALLKLRSSGFRIADIPLATCDDSSVRCEIMSAAARKLGSQFDSISYFGDAEWDREACRHLGWDFVAVGPTLDGIASYDGVVI